MSMIGRTQRSEQKVTSENGFQRCALRKHVRPLSGLPVRYEQDVIDLLRQTASLLSSEPNFVLRSVHNPSVYPAGQYHSMSRPYSHSDYNAAQPDIMYDSRRLILD